MEIAVVENPRRALLFRPVPIPCVYSLTPGRNGATGFPSRLAGTPPRPEGPPRRRGAPPAPLPAAQCVVPAAACPPPCLRSRRGSRGDDRAPAGTLATHRHRAATPDARGA